MYQVLTALSSPFPALYILVAAGLIVLWRKRVESRGRLLVITVPFVDLGILSIPAVGHLAQGSLEWSYPPQIDLPSDGEALVVLSGDMRPPDARVPEVELGDATLLRCLHAARLYHRRPCPVLVCGGRVGVGIPGPTLAQAMHDFLITQGVKEKDLLLEDQSSTTYENALHARALLCQREIKKIVLVTSATHMQRAEKCFRAQGLEVAPSACDYLARRFAWSVRDFLPNSRAIAKWRLRHTSGWESCGIGSWGGSRPHRASSDAACATQSAERNP